jgi:hypothetical protein
MLVATLTDPVVDKKATLAEACMLVWAHPQVRSEMVQLLDVLSGQIDHLSRGIETPPDVPLRIHARYTRIEILAALGVGEGAKVAPWQSGVYWSPGANADLLAFTLDKTEGEFSPRTRYRDYAISRDLIHWESQAGTRADSATGRRYQRHASGGSKVLLFARLRTSDRAFWSSDRRRTSAINRRRRWRSRGASRCRYPGISSPHSPLPSPEGSEESCARPRLHDEWPSRRPLRRFAGTVGQE